MLRKQAGWLQALVRCCEDWVRLPSFTVGPCEEVETGESRSWRSQHNSDPISES